MKAQISNLLWAVLNIALIIIAGLYKFGRRIYRRFCIKVLWKRFQIRTSVYHQWHDRRAKKLQEALDNQHNNQHSMYPSF